MNPPPSSQKSPRPVRLIWLASVIVLLAVLSTYALRSGKTKPESPPEAKPLESIRLETAQMEATDRLRAALDTDADPRGLARADALRAIGDDLTSGESNALLAVLLTPRDPSAPEGPHSVGFHETALALHKQATIRGEFARTLATVARDLQRDHVIRDYAIQHLGQLWQNSDPALADRIQATLVEIADKSPDIAPSAILALHLLGTPSTPHAVADGKLEPRVRKLLAKDETTSTAARMTALRIVGERRLAGFHDDLARIAADSTSGHTLVRMAAIAAIARFTDPDDLPLLRDLDHSDPRMASAIQHAIARIESNP